MTRKEKRQQRKLREKRGIIKEFREFISRGSVMDLAVGIIIGSAFTAIVNSVVKDLITPLIGILIGGIDFSSLTVTLPGVFSDAPPPVFAYGVFLQAVINFFIIAVCVFAIIKFMNTVKRRIDTDKAEPAPEALKPAEIELLEEIRDLLKKNAEKTDA